MSEPYSNRALPPMPALSIRLRSDATDKISDPIIALVDTAADATLAPLQYLLEIGSEETAPGWLRGVTGERLPAALYFVDIRVDHAAFPSVRAIGSSEAEEILLGRDVLNKLSLFLDGPEQQTDLLDDATEIGWTYLAPDKALTLRGGETGLFFGEVLADQLRKLNPRLVFDPHTVLRQLESLRVGIEGNHGNLLSPPPCRRGGSLKLRGRGVEGSDE